MRYSEVQKEYLIAAACRPEVGPVSMRRILKACVNSGMDIADIGRFSSIELQDEIGLSPRPAEELAALEFPFEQGRRMWEQIESRGAGLLFDDDGAYPVSLTECLGTEAPPVLFVAGCIELLSGPCIGIVGSRRPSPTAAKAARDFAARLAEKGWKIVSGAAAGIDTCGHLGALSTGGGTIVLPPQGIFRFGWDHHLRKLLDDDNWLLMSQFPPAAGWEARYALMRNKMITALSRTVVAFEPRDRGGTWHSSNTALQMGKPLFVASFRKGPPYKRGRDCLVRRGAGRLHDAALTDTEGFETLLHKHGGPPQAYQNFLFGSDSEHH